MNKKIIALLLCLIMAVLTLAGCSGSMDRGEKENGSTIGEASAESEETGNMADAGAFTASDSQTTEAQATPEPAATEAPAATGAPIVTDAPTVTPGPEEETPSLDVEAIKEALEFTLNEAVDPAQRDALTEMSTRYKLLGRVYVAGDTIWCGFSGTGIEFVYNGKKLDITLVGDTASLGAADSQARFAVYINGERVLDEMLDKKEKNYTVYDSSVSEAAAPVTVKVIKLSECAQSTFGIKNIEIAEGESISPTEAKAHKIEFIGDSITCGYGVDDEVKEHHFSTTTEDVTKTYGYKTAELLDADCSMVSMSGWGIISGYTSDPSKKSASQLIPDIYEKVGYSYQSFNTNIKPQLVNWDFAQFRPDAIVINLGTNDASYVKYDIDKRNEYKDAYIEFIKKVRSYNPEADIYCVLGIMGSDLYTPLENAVMAYRDETGDTAVRAIKLNTQSGKYGYAADWHPTEGTHEEAAATLVEKIIKYSGWEKTE